LFEPCRFIFSQIRRDQLRPAFSAAQHIQAGVGRNACQPSFHRAATGETFYLCEGFQEGFLCGLFGLAAIPKEPVSNVEDSRAEASNDFGEGILIFVAREAGQFNFGRLFVVVRQKRILKKSVRTASGSDRINALLS